MKEDRKRGGLLQPRFFLKIVPMGVMYLQCVKEIQCLSHDIYTRLLNQERDKPRNSTKRQRD